MLESQIQSKLMAKNRYCYQETSSLHNCPWSYITHLRRSYFFTFSSRLNFVSIFISTVLVQVFMCVIKNHVNCSDYLDTVKYVLMSMEHWRIYKWKETCPCTALSTKNPTMSEEVLKTDLRIERPATTRTDLDMNLLVQVWIFLEKLFDL